jgi:hypothetical protein
MHNIKSTGKKIFILIFSSNISFYPFLRELSRPKVNGQGMLQLTGANSWDNGKMA